MTTNVNRRGFIKRTIGVTVGAAAVPFISSCAGNTRTASAAKPATSASAQAKEHIVEIQGFQFSPANLTVKPGDTVTWINRDSAPHTATATDKSWDTGSIAQNGRKSLTMTAGMTASYYCAIHPAMKATVSVA